MASIVIGDYLYQTVELGQGKKTVRAFAEGAKTSYGEILSEVTIEGTKYPVTSLESCFSGNTTLITAPAIPNSVTNMRNTFRGCTSLTAAPVIPESVKYMAAAFSRCTALTGNIVINSTPNSYTDIFYNTQKGIWLTGASTNLSSLALEDNNNNVYVGEIPLSYALTIERVAGDGGTVQDPEGIWAHVQLTINWAVFAENSIEAITLKNGAATVSPTWYTDAAKTSTISLPNWQPGANTTIHCWIEITSATHVFSVTVADRYHTGGVISFTVPQQFRTMDFLKGGQGIAFGMPATQVGFHCNMATRFLNDLKKYNGTRDIDLDISETTIQEYIDLGMSLSEINLLDRFLAFIAEKLNWSGFNYTWDINTANTADTWVPVMNGNTIQHRVEADWIVDGGWKDFGNYRWMWKRWNKGVQELDLIYQFTNSPYSTWNNMQARKVSISWGGDIGKYFLDTEYEITQHWEVGSGFAIPATILSKGTGSCEVFGLSSAGGSQTCRLSAHIVGRWK